MYDPEPFRREIPLLERMVPLNNCSQAPQSDRTRRGADRYLQNWAETGMDWEAWIGEVELARAEFAALIGAESADVSVGSSVSALLSSLAGAFDFPEERDRILACAGEFPTVLHVWGAQERRGAGVDEVPALDGMVVTGDYIASIDDRTAIVSVSHGLYGSGCVVDPTPIAEAARAAGAVTVVDAYQTLGTRPIDVTSMGADVITSGCLKYLMGVPGLAFMWVRPGLAQRLEPLATGWFGRANPYAFTSDLDWAPGARRFDLGTPPIFEAYVVREGLSWIREVGPPLIQTWTEGLTAHVIDRARVAGISVLGPQLASFRTPSTALLLDDAAGLETALRTEGFLVSARGPVLRIAPHFYSTLEDIDGVMDALLRLLAVRA